MNERVSWKFRRAYSDGLVCMTLVEAGDLKSMVALRAANQYSLPPPQIMEPLENESVKAEFAEQFRSSCT